MPERRQQGTQNKVYSSFPASYMMEIIGVDTGNKAMKTPGCAPFSTGLICHGTEEPAIRGDTLRWNGNYYSLSEHRTIYKADKTADDTYYVLTLIAIAKNLMRRYPNQKFYRYDIALGLGLPPQHMGRLKQKYIDYFGRKGEMVNYIYQDASFEISVRRVFVFPQGFVISSDPTIQQNIKKHIRSYIVDIGGHTTDVIRFNHYQPDLNFMESYEDGIINMLSAVESTLRAKCGLSVDDYMAEGILLGESSLTGEETTKIAAAAADAYAQKILRNIGEKVGDDIKTCYFIFMGGGASMMRPAIEKVMNTANTVFVTDVTANAKGYEVLVKAALMQEK